MNRNIKYNEEEDYQQDGPTGRSNYDSKGGKEELEEKWYDIEDEYRDQYPDLTDSDVEVEPGRFQNTMERIAHRRGKTHQEIRTEIENW